MLVALLGASFGVGFSIIPRFELALPGFIPSPSLQYNSRITFHGILTIPSTIMPLCSFNALSMRYDISEIKRIKSSIVGKFIIYFSIRNVFRWRSKCWLNFSRTATITKLFLSRFFILSFTLSWIKSFIRLN